VVMVLMRETVIREVVSLDCSAAITAVVYRPRGPVIRQKTVMTDLMNCLSMSTVVRPHCLHHVALFAFNE